MVRFSNQGDGLDDEVVLLDQVGEPTVLAWR
jgi:hypothetical protein